MVSEIQRKGKRREEKEREGAGGGEEYRRLRDWQQKGTSELVKISGHWDFRLKIIAASGGGGGGGVQKSKAVRLRADTVLQF